MPTVFDVPADVYIERLKNYLKENVPEIDPPSWAQFVKTGSHAERTPVDPDWWHVRAASLLRKVYIKGPIGLSKLRSFYGGRRGPGSIPEHFRKGGGSIVRKILQQLEEAELVEILDRKGRVVTGKGRSLLDSLSRQVKKEIVKEVPELKKYG